MPYSLPIPGYGQPPVGNALGGGVSPLLQMLLQMVTQASGGYQEAKQANESRYQDTLKLFGDNRQRTLDGLDSLSGQQVADANKAYDDKRKNLIADLADRGLGGSSKRIAVESMTQRERDAAVNRIKDTLLQNRNAADLGFTDRAAGVMERRSDPYPNPNTNISSIVAQLAPLLGAGGAGALSGLFGGGPFASSNSAASAGGQQAIRNYLPGYVAPAVTPEAPGNAANRRNAIDNQAANAASDEAKRRAALIALHNTDHVGGYSNLAEIQSILNYQQGMGFAEWNPTASAQVPDIRRGNEQPIYANHGGYGGYGGGGGYSRPQYSAEQLANATNQRIAGYRADRNSYYGTPGYQDAMASPEYQVNKLLFDEMQKKGQPGTYAGGGFF